MIRSTITAHLAETNKRELTLQLNDRDIGLLASQHQRHYVMSGNRRVQMITGLETDRESHDSVVSTRALLRLWLMTFRELQINGLLRFPQCVDRNHLSCDFLFLMDSRGVYVWCTPSFALYLHRGGRLYRQQPTYSPSSDPHLSAFCRGLDFYTFRPAENDNILVIDPEFIDLFVASELEEMFSETRQLNVSMSELMRLAALSGYPADTTWFSCQVQKLEHEPEALSADARERASGKKQNGYGEDYSWPYNLVRSKVIPLREGNVRVLPAQLKNRRNYPSTDDAQVSLPKPPTFRPFATDAEYADERAIRLDEDSTSADTKKRNPLDRFKRLKVEELEKPTRMERIKLWDAGRIQDYFSQLYRRMTHLFPGSKGLSLLAVIAIVLVLIVLLIGVTKGIQRKSLNKPNESRPVIVSPITSKPDTYDFEVEVTVEASSLRILSEPDGDELVATVQRGDKVTQLKKPVDGWVLIRLNDGRIGYVRMDLLYPNTQSTQK